MATSKKLVRKLRRELFANPKKGAALALLLAVAVWFWMPLIEKYFVPKSEDVAVTEPNVGAGNSTANASIPATGAEGDESTDIHWKQVVDWIHDDPMMHPQLPPPGARNPFAPSESRRLAREKVEQSSQPPPPADVTPEQSGLVLRSTVIGSRKKTAMINERAYHEGQTVKAPKANDQFKLVRIATNYVVLESGGKQYQLKLPAPDLAGVDE